MESSFPLSNKGMPCSGLSTGLQETYGGKNGKETVVIIKGLENMTYEEKLEKTLYCTALAEQEEMGLNCSEDNLGETLESIL